MSKSLQSTVFVIVILTASACVTQGRFEAQAARAKRCQSREVDQQRSRHALRLEVARLTAELRRKNAAAAAATAARDQAQRRIHSLQAEVKRLTATVAALKREKPGGMLAVLANTVLEKAAVARRNLTLPRARKFLTRFYGSKLGACLRDHHDKQRGRQAIVTLLIQIKPSGRVGRVRIQRGSYEDRKAHGCLTRIVTKVTFPRPAKRRVLSVKFVVRGGPTALEGLFD